MNEPECALYASATVVQLFTRSKKPGNATTNSKNTHFQFEHKDNTDAGSLAIVAMKKPLMAKIERFGPMSHAKRRRVQNDRTVGLGWATRRGKLACSSIRTCDGFL